MLVFTRTDAFTTMTIISALMFLLLPLGRGPEISFSSRILIEGVMRVTAWPRICCRHIHRQKWISRFFLVGRALVQRAYHGMGINPAEGNEHRMVISVVREKKNNHGVSVSRYRFQTS
ncbi:hypothetical protein F5X99DRAFT_374529 [Biscogniauxia marginata]|nr:hypothetical protein F5X99DRAFT_374529 [Biscogniauxia marginata]